jgi:hypothetical protein
MIILYHRNTIVFFFDCYILTPSLFLLALIIFYFNKKIVAAKFSYILLSISLLFALYTSQESRKYTDSEKFWLSSYKRSHTCHSKLLYAYNLWYVDKQKEAYDASIELMNSHCKEISQTFQVSLYKLVIAKTIEFDKTLSAKEKEKLRRVLFRKETEKQLLLDKKKPK